MAFALGLIPCLHDPNTLQYYPKFSKPFKMASDGSDWLISEFPHPTKWTFEILDKTVQQAKDCLEWKLDGEITSIWLGVELDEVEFSAWAMRQHSLYFRVFSLPTIAYVEYFIKNTEDLLLLTTEEVDVFEWIVGWCHDGGRPAGQPLFDLNDGVPLNVWVMIWRVADVLGMAPLQLYVTNAFLQRATTEFTLPSPAIVEYLWDHRPYNIQDHAIVIWDAIISKHAHAPGSLIDNSPELFLPCFVNDVHEYRRRNDLPRPGEITAYTQPRNQEIANADGDNVGDETS